MYQWEINKIIALFKFNIIPVNKITRKNKQNEILKNSDININLSRI